MPDSYTTNMREHLADCYQAHGLSSAGSEQVANHEQPSDPADQAMMNAYDSPASTGKSSDQRPGKPALRRQGSRLIRGQHRHTIRTYHRPLSRGHRKTARTYRKRRLDTRPPIIITITIQTTQLTTTTCGLAEMAATPGWAQVGARTAAQQIARLISRTHGSSGRLSSSVCPIHADVRG
jgi:hypothetical protein